MMPTGTALMTHKKARALEWPLLCPPASWLVLNAATLAKLVVSGNNHFITGTRYLQPPEPDPVSDMHTTYAHDRSNRDGYR